MAAIAELLGDGIYDKSANKVDAGSQLAGKVVGLYFSGKQILNKLKFFLM